MYGIITESMIKSKSTKKCLILTLTLTLTLALTLNLIHISKGCHNEN